jgi:hypothetical protein
MARIRTEKPWMCHCCHHPFVAPVIMDGRKHSPCCSSLNMEGPAPAGIIALDKPTAVCDSHGMDTHKRSADRVDGETTTGRLCGAPAHEPASHGRENVTCQDCKAALAAMAKKK